MYEENLNQLYTQVHVVNNPLPMKSNLSESLRSDTNVVYTLEIDLSNFNASSHGKTSSTSSTFLTNSFIGKAPNTPTNEKVRKKWKCSKTRTLKSCKLTK